MNGKIWIDPIEQVSVASILNEVAQVLGLPDLTKWSLGDLSSELTSVLASQRTLLVLDNFEAVPEKNAIIQTLYPIFHGIGRILITTREVINHFDQYNHKIWAMNEMDSLAFLKAEPKDNNVKRIIDSAEETQLGALYEATGGLPLAMRLVVGQLFSMTLEDVLAYLKEARSTHTSDSDANYQFYFFIYHASWRQLDPTSRVLLLSMSLFTPNSGDRISRIRQVFRENLSKAQERFGITVTGDEFQHASETLIRMSLIDKLGSLGQENLAIHTITRHFVQGEIVKLWG